MTEHNESNTKTWAKAILATAFLASSPMLLAQGASHFTIHKLDHSQFQNGFENNSRVIILEASSSNSANAPQEVRLTKPIIWQCPSSTSEYGNQCLSTKSETRSRSYQACGDQYGGHGMNWGFGFTKITLPKGTWVKYNDHLYLRGTVDQVLSKCDLYNSSRKKIIEKEASCPSGYDLEGAVCAKYVYQ